MNIADDLVNAFNDGYKQGKVDAVMRCGECKRCGRLTDGSLFCGRIKTGVYGMYHVVRSDDYCSYGAKMERVS